MSGPSQSAGPDRDRIGGHLPGRPPGLLGKLVAAIRPEFRAGDLVFDPRDPVFGGPACAVADCVRPARRKGMCPAHRYRWEEAGRPDLAQFSATTGAGWHGHSPVMSCEVSGCMFGRQAYGLCQRHARQWKRAGRPDPAIWRACGAPWPPPSPLPRTCRVGYCELWARGTSLLCTTHDARWRAQRCPEIDDFIASCQDPGPGSGEHIDLRRLPQQLRLEVQYVLQCRRDEETARMVPALTQRIVTTLAATTVSSVLDQPERFWMTFIPPPGSRVSGWHRFILDAYQRIEVLAVGQGWDIEYPRDLWRLRNLGISHNQLSTLSFEGIPQPWLKDLAKRWARWQLSTGLGAGTAYDGAHALTRFARFLAAAEPATTGSLAQVDRPFLERYLADLHGELNGRKIHGHHLGALNGFLRAIRQHGWDSTLPATAVVFPEDYPKRGDDKLPRALAARVMAQIEQPASLARWDNPAYLLITVILIRCGLRINDACKLPFGCVVTDADGAPYLRYYNHKMKREALVPIDEELHRQASEQQQRVLQCWPGGVPVLFPRLKANLDGQRPVRDGTYRKALYRWLECCDIRDENNKPVHLTPHQFRHTLGSFLINKDVPQEVVRKILDHDSHEMTAHYARLNDTTIRRHWEAATKVNARGETVTLDPDGLIADAAWAKQRVGRATQALPNGFCGLPVVKSCPHANACLTCPMFLTTREYLAEHRHQHRQTLQIISAAQARGQMRMAEMNRQVAGNLEKIIIALERDDDSGEQVTADAI